MTNIDWGAAMRAAQEGRLADFFSRVLERRSDEERGKIAYKVDSFTQFTENVFRIFAEEHSHLLGVNEGLAVLESIPGLKATCATAGEFREKLGAKHAHALLMFREGATVDDPKDNRIATRLYKIVYEFHMEYLKDYLKGETK